MEFKDDRNFRCYVHHLTRDVLASYVKSSLVDRCKNQRERKDLFTYSACTSADGVIAPPERGCSFITPTKSSFAARWDTRVSDLGPPGSPRNRLQP